MALRWYVLRTEPRVEHSAAGELGRDGFEILFPNVRTAHRQANHTDSPLFPGYLFLRWDSENRGWPTFRPAHRVLGLVRFQGNVPSIPDPVIDELVDRLETMNRQGGLWKRFHPGQQVRVVSNNIEALGEVVYEGKSPQARVKVLLSFMGGLVSAQVPWENLWAVEDDPAEAYRAHRRTRGRGRWIQGFGPRAVPNT